MYTHLAWLATFVAIAAATFPTSCKPASAPPSGLLDGVEITEWCVTTGAASELHMKLQVKAPLTWAAVSFGTAMAGNHNPVIVARDVSGTWSSESRTMIGSYGAPQKDATGPAEEVTTANGFTTVHVKRAMSELPITAGETDVLLAVGSGTEMQWHSGRTSTKLTFFTQTSAAAPEQQGEGQSASGISSGAVVGIACAAAAVGAGIALLVAFIVMRKKKNTAETAEQDKKAMLEYELRASRMSDSV